MDSSNIFVVSAAPLNLNDNELQDFFDNLISEYKGSMMDKNSDRSAKVFSSIARRMAVKAVKPLLTEEMRQIVNDLMKCNMPAVSPSGERISLILSSEKFKHLFKFPN